MPKASADGGQWVKHFDRAGRGGERLIAPKGKNPKASYGLSLRRLFEANSRTPIMYFLFIFLFFFYNHLDFLGCLIYF